MSLEDILRNTLVKAPLVATSRDEAIDELCSLIANNRGLDEQSASLAEAVRRREQEGGPQELPGIVITHARSQVIGSHTLAIGKCSRPMDWEGENTQNVKLVCMLIVPENERLELLGTQLGQVFNNGAVLDRLHQCNSEADFRNFFRRIGTDLDAPRGFILERLIGKQPDVVRALAWASQGNALAFATAHRDHAIRVWKDDGDFSRELRGHQATILHLAWSRNDEQMATGGEDMTARVWQVADGATVRIIESDPSAVVHGVAWSPDGRMLALAGHLGVHLRDTPNWQQGKTLAGPNIMPAFCVGWSPDGELLAAAGGRGYAAVQLWEGRSPKMVHRLEQGQEPIVAMAWSPDNRFLAIGDVEGTVYVWNRSNWGALTTTIRAHRGQVTSLSFSHDSAYLASKSDDGTVKLWETRDWSEVAQLLDPTTGGLWAPLSFHPKQLRLATLGGLSGNSIRIWRIDRTELPVPTVCGRPVPVQPPAEQIDVPRRLVKAVLGEEAVLFAGAGMSAAWLGVTTTYIMRQLAEEIADECSDYDAGDRTFEVMAEEYAALFGFDMLANKISDLIPRDLDISPHHNAAAAVFKTTITTNWDLLFENAYAEAGKEYRVVSCDDEANAIRHDREMVIKMHGSADRPTTLVATSHQYELYHKTHAKLLERVAELLRDKVVVFAGYGLRDEHIRRLVSSVHENQAAWSKAAYAIGLFDEVRTRVLVHRGITVINCDVAAFFPELAQRVAADRRT
ncbi:MAG: SIR2 family protein [Phycisphaerae bacterium]|nr:SIR2 family protein [Phycisphaerae bacterium]